MRLVFLLVFNSIVSVQAQQFDKVFVDQGWLQSNLTEKNLVVLHVGSAEGYSNGHIAGAIYISNRSYYDVFG